MGEQATRLKRPSWRDPRLGIGLILVALSVAIGVVAFDSASQTVAVWAAARTITPGEPIAEAVVTVEVSPNLSEHYLDAWQPAAGTATRVIEPGELIPATAITEEDRDWRSIVIPLGAPISEAVAAGARVDLWLAPEAAGAQLVLENLVVRAVVAEESGFAASSNQAVELIVAAAQVGTILTAMNEDGSMYVIPRPG